MKRDTSKKYHPESAAHILMQASSRPNSPVTKGRYDLSILMLLGLLLLGMSHFSLVLAAGFNQSTANDDPSQAFEAPRPENVSDKQWNALKAALQQTRLWPSPDGRVGDSGQFGSSVAVDGNRALIAAPGALNSRGIVFVMDYIGGSWVKTQELTAVDGEAYDYFGYSVSLSGNRALIGAYGDNDNGAFSGSVYVFELSNGNWFQAAKLTASDGAANDYFGQSVSLSGGRALVGAPYDNTGNAMTGSAYVFDLNNGVWSQTAKLVAADGADFDFFGQSVSLSGGRALIGASFDDTGNGMTGSAYVFDLNNGVWSQTAKLVATDGAAFDYFGTSVSLSGDRVLVGAYGDDDNGSLSGSVYFFELSGGSWSQTAKLVAGDGVAGDQFGFSVSVSGDRAVVGARLADDNSIESGAVYVFDFSGGGWLQTAKLISADGAAGDGFGFSVSLSGDRILGGAPDDDDHGSNSGSAYVFDLSGGAWQQTAKLTAGPNAQDDEFGTSVSLSGNRAVVGAPWDGDNGVDSGSAYIFDYSAGVWTRTAKLTAADGTANDGFGISVSVSGDRVLVGNLTDSVYVFELGNGVWTQTAKLTAADAATGDGFGTSVSLSGARALIGAPYDDTGSATTGSAYVFEHSGGVWSQTAKLTASDGVASDGFGQSVSLSGTRALIGTPSVAINTASTGSAYVFDLSAGNWAETAKLVALDGAAGDRFGYSVSLSGDRTLVGAYGDDDNGADSGSAYVFDLTGGGWAQTAKLIAQDNAAADEFGYSVSLSGDRVLVGAHYDDDNGTDSGSAYVFEFGNGNWSQTDKLMAADGVFEDYFGESVSLSGDRALIGVPLDDDRGDDSGSASIFLLDEVIFKNGFETP